MGVEQTVSALARSLGLKPDTVLGRLRNGKSMEEATTQGRLNGWRHGTRCGYEVHCCKCAECRAANAKRQRDRRAQRLPKPPAPEQP